jgi:nicotinate-nucleotide pyrophosphorylase (carboxylating)
MGGATNHRMSLNDGVMIKDNHIRLGGGIANALTQVRAFGAKRVVEVEVETLNRSTRRSTPEPISCCSIT